MIEIVLPHMGEGIIEADITRWLVREGAHVEAEEPLVEVATDKVDSEIPSPGSGILHKIMLKEGDTAKVGQVLALIAEQDEKVAEPDAAGAEPSDVEYSDVEPSHQESTKVQSPPPPDLTYPKTAFLSPVVRKIAVENGLSPAEIEGIQGSGAGGRITRTDMLEYLAGMQVSGSPEPHGAKTGGTETAGTGTAGTKAGETARDGHEPGGPQAGTGNLHETGGSQAILSREQIYGNGPHTVEEMDRMRKLIADHMVYSMQTSPHVTSFVESDVTEMIRWRERVRNEFQDKYNQKLTVTTLILEAVIRALKEYPRINVSVDANRIILKHGIHLGMAAALPDGNLIVPVIHDADKLNLGGLAARVNDLAGRARENKLKPAEIQGGTFTVTNLGQFGNITGTPIINQPQAAILAVGAIVKKPAVVETPKGDSIGIRHMMILSLAYDHRVIDGALGGSFLKSIGDHLQNSDPARTI